MDECKPLHGGHPTPVKFLPALPQGGGKEGGDTDGGGTAGVEAEGGQAEGGQTEGLDAEGGQNEVGQPDDTAPELRKAPERRVRAGSGRQRRVSARGGRSRSPLPPTVTEVEDFAVGSPLILSAAAAAAGPTAAAEATRYFLPDDRIGPRAPLGKAVHVDPIQHTLKAFGPKHLKLKSPGPKHLQLKHDKLLSSFLSNSTCAASAGCGGAIRRHQVQPLLQALRR